MPKIHEYTPQQNAPSPVSISSNPNDFGAQAYQGAKELGSGLEDAGTFLEKRATQAEVSDLSASLSKFHAQKLQELQDNLRTADPGDRTIVDKFMDKYDQDLQSVQDSIQTPGGRNYFERSNERLRSSILTSAAHGQAELAGAQASSNLLQLKNYLSDAAMRDPTDKNFDVLMQQANDSVDAQVQHGMIDQAPGIQLKSNISAEIAKSAVLGWSQKNPDYAKKLLQSERYDKYLDGDQKEALFGRIQSAENAKRLDEERRIRLQQQAVEVAQEKTKNHYLDLIEKNQLSATDILEGKQLPEGGMPLDASAKEHYQKLAESRATMPPGFHEHSPAFQSILDRLHLPDGNPNKIVSYDQVVPFITTQKTEDGRTILPSLSWEDGKLIKQELSERGTQEGSDESTVRKGVLDLAKPFLRKNPITQEIDPQGQTLYNRAVRLMMKKWADGRKAGIPVDELADDKSKNYVGSILSSPAFQRDIPSIFADTMAQYFPAEASPSPTPSPSPTSKDREERVDVIDPKGNRYSLPKKKVQMYIEQRGFRLAP